MKKAVFTVEEYNGANNAGPKAKTDIDFFLQNEGFHIIHRHFNVHSKVAKFFDYYFSIPRIFDKNKFYDELFFQYPTYSSFLMKKLVTTLRAHCKYLYFIIHDVEALRIFAGDKEYWQGEKALFNQTDGLIVHNDHMKKWLVDNGVKVPMVSLEIFDYQTEFQPKADSREYNYSVCFAGNLKKSHFLDSLELQHSSLSVYGPNASSHYGQGVTYKGQYSPDELPKHLTQSFGLVWDGSSVDTCNGKFGEYMKFNNPHKVSLYLTSGLPVIIWKQAALADFIQKNHLGFVIKSLSEMDHILGNMSPNTYHEYCKNVLQLSSKLRNGYFIKKAVSKIESFEK